mmetsp:Transcript_13429/g.15083  ORF Transcript_13429/g.15083 Transcript_13429/m.15083 type:complete len:131 (+) Transcript_13429:14-406(+)
MGSSASAATFENVDTAKDIYDNLKLFTGSEFSKSNWYQILIEDFEENDTTNKGYLTKSEIDNTLEEYFSLKEITPTDELKEDYFKKINTSGDEKITFEELYQFAKTAIESDFLPDFEKKCKEHSLELWSC